MSSKRSLPSDLHDVCSAFHKLPLVDPSPASSHDRAVLLAQSTDQQDALAKLDETWAERSTRPLEAIDAAGNASIDGQSVQILVQSIRRMTFLSGSQAPAPLVPCPPGTVWTWTKYFRGAMGEEADASLGQPAAKKQKTTTSRSADRHPAKPVFDLISSVASCPDLVFHICTYLRPADVFVLYRTSRVFKATIDANLPAATAYLGRLYAPEALAIFPWGLFRQRTALTSPTLCYLSMLLSRDRKARDIIAVLARSGHRLPRTNATAALKKIWLLMDVATNRGRLALLQNKELFADDDLLTMQMFCVKLTMHFREPLFNDGPDADGGISTLLPSENSLAQVLLGQHDGLDPLWRLLRRKMDRPAHEVIKLKVRYDYLPPLVPKTVVVDGQILDNRIMPVAERKAEGDAQWTATAAMNVDPGPVSDLDSEATTEVDSAVVNAVYDAAASRPGVSPFDSLLEIIKTVPLWEMAVGHLEGWGLGTQHLLRPDELIQREAARRQLDLRSHLPFLAVWGSRDFATGENLVPTFEEMYISDDEDQNAGNQTSSTETLKITQHPIMQPNAHPSTPQGRLARLVGNVPCAPGEWQPWQVLKAQWSSLALSDKVDVWWLCQQERLKTLAWMPVTDELDDPTVAGMTAMSLFNTDEIDGDANKHDAIDGDDMYISSDTEGDSFAMEGGSPDCENKSPSRRGYPPSGPQGPAQGVPQRCRHRRASDGNSGSANSIASSLRTITQRSLSHRHERLIAASVQSAMYQQKHADETLLAQSDESYEEEELEWWEQTLATVAGDEAEVEDDEADGNGDEPDPTHVHEPQYGGPDDVLVLLEQLAAAEAAVAEPLSEDTMAAIAQRARHHAQLEQVRKRLDTRLSAEVFALDFMEN